MLGFNTRVVKATRGSTFGVIKENSFFSHVQCSGTEKSLSDCQYDDISHVSDCQEKAAGVICGGI